MRRKGGKAEGGGGLADRGGVRGETVGRGGRRKEEGTAAGPAFRLFEEEGQNGSRRGGRNTDPLHLPMRQPITASRPNAAEEAEAALLKAETAASRGREGKGGRAGEGKGGDLRPAGRKGEGGGRQLRPIGWAGEGKEGAEGGGGEGEGGGGRRGGEEMYA